MEGKERYRMDVCNKCRCYIKIVELHNFAEEPNLDVEDIITLHLNMIAFEEVYN